MMWLNWSVATINATLQLLDIYRLDLEYVMTDSILLAFSFIDNKLYEASGFF